MSCPGVRPSPLRDKVGAFHHVRFRGYYPFTFVLACTLPVYASQRPSPDATQDSVHGCWLGFAAAAIPGGWTSCACKAQPSQNRTCGPRIRLFGSIDQSASESWSDTSGGLRSFHRVSSDTSRPLNQATGYARVIPGRLDRCQGPRPQYAAPAAAFRLAPRVRRCRNKKRGRFFWRTMIALSRRRMWASITPNTLMAAREHRR